MHFSVNLKLKWRLLGGFLLCALFTGIIMALGVFSAIGIRNELKEGLDDKMQRIDVQKNRIENLIPLRGLVLKITKGANADELSEAAQTVESLKRRAKEGGSREYVSIIDAFDTLLIHKLDQTAAYGEMDRIQSEISDVLETLGTIVANISDTAEYNSTMAIEETVVSSEEEFKQISETIGNLFLNVELPARIRSDLTAANVLLKDAIITDSRDRLDEIQSEISLLFQNIVTRMERVPQIGLNPEIESSFSNFTQAASIIIAARQKLLASSAYRETSTGNELKTLFYEINGNFAELSELLAGAAEKIKLASESRYNETAERIKAYFNNISFIANQALVGTKAAYAVAASSNLLKAEIREVFIVNDAEPLKRMEQHVLSLISSIERDASWLPENRYQDSLLETQNRIKALSAELFVIKKRLLNAGVSLEESSGAIMGRMCEVDDSILESARDIRTNAVRIMAVGDDLIERSIFLQIMIGFAVFLICIIVGLPVTKSISGSIKRIIRELSKSAGQIFSAADQVSSSGRTLAALADRQVAAVEETASSLEQMASMTRQNADNANKAASLTIDTATHVNQAYESMDKLTASMSEISRASEETAGIVKNIDEIAFQTNLLALNAAVEAARAGESGAGFAVVAEEVRNLAHRAADASGHTAVRIRETVEKVKEGVELLNSAHTVFTRMTEKTAAVKTLIEEIAAASKKQSGGIEQMNRGASEIGQAVHENAAAAEESASASNMMHIQAKQLNDIVRELTIMVEGEGKIAGENRPVQAG